MEKVKEISLSYYARKDIQSAIYQFAQNREAIPRYGEGFGKRPDSFQYESDILEYARKGATSFHVSEELWYDPLQIATGMSQEEANNQRKGWDLLIDIDSKYLDFSKITAQLILRALEFHGIRNYGIKFSGSKGFHLMVPWQAFPEEFQGVKTKEMFPEWARMISLYITDLIKSELIEKVSSAVSEKSYIKDFDAPKKVMPDIILVSPRHLFRAPYSLHEKTALASIVIDKNDLKNFNPQQANPLGIKTKNFLPDSRKNEAKELLTQALDWHSEQQKDKKRNS
jgi:DNA primase catalytic subunit